MVSKAAASASSELGSAVGVGGAGAGAAEAAGAATTPTAAAAAAASSCVRLAAAIQAVSYSDEQSDAGSGLSSSAVGSTAVVGQNVAGTAVWCAIAESSCSHTSAGRRSKKDVVLRNKRCHEKRRKRGRGREGPGKEHENPPTRYVPLNRSARHTRCFAPRRRCFSHETRRCKIANH